MPSNESPAQPDKYPQDQIEWLTDLSQESTPEEQRYVQWVGEDPSIETALDMARYLQSREPGIDADNGWRALDQALYDAYTYQNDLEISNPDSSYSRQDQTGELRRATPGEHVSRTDKALDNNNVFPIRDDIVIQEFQPGIDMDENDERARYPLRSPGRGPERVNSRERVVIKYSPQPSRGSVELKNRLSHLDSQRARYVSALASRRGLFGRTKSETRDVKARLAYASALGRAGESAQRELLEQGYSYDEIRAFAEAGNQLERSRVNSGINNVLREKRDYRKMRINGLLGRDKPKLLKIKPAKAPVSIKIRRRTR